MKRPIELLRFKTRKGETHIVELQAVVAWTAMLLAVLGLALVLLLAPHPIR